MKESPQVKAGYLSASGRTVPVTDTTLATTAPVTVSTSLAP